MSASSRNATRGLGLMGILRSDRITGLGETMPKWMFFLLKTIASFGYTFKILVMVNTERMDTSKGYVHLPLMYSLWRVCIKCLYK